MTKGQIILNIISDDQWKVVILGNRLANAWWLMKSAAFLIKDGAVTLVCRESKREGVEL